LTKFDRILEVGCAKGFLLKEFYDRGIGVYGVDISEYAIEHTHPDIRGLTSVEDATDLPFSNKEFSFLISKETLPHMSEVDVKRVILECDRVTLGNMYFVIQCVKKIEQACMMKDWDCTHQLCWTPEIWRDLFSHLYLSNKFYLEFKFLFS